MLILLCCLLDAICGQEPLPDFPCLLGIGFFPNVDFCSAFVPDGVACFGEPLHPLGGGVAGGLIVFSRLGHGEGHGIVKSCR
ncbi:hypothetical protein [Arthrobacter sp. PsM3]|uniref:hypothetical protein n=1 Tax=Arthrobacter sp. PsM3 TaxID=3030531 RepID=UPI00263A46A5|nr:hypothetical protein [Arthrobacter sp. PsM3]MDN4645992.1 hypothetical protein [Arthrobacter sp. PsM3]